MKPHYEFTVSEAANLDRLVDRLAQALAEADGEEDAAAFAADKAHPVADVDSTYVLYVDTVRDMLKKARLTGVMAMVAELIGLDRDLEIDASSPIEKIETYIAQREVDVAHISAQIESAERNDEVEHNTDWQRSARHALQIKRKQLCFALRLRLKVMRYAGDVRPAAWDEETQVVMAASPMDPLRKLKKLHEGEIAKLTTELAAARLSRNVERNKRIQHINRLGVARNVMMAHIRVEAPGILQGVIEHVDAVQAELDLAPESYSTIIGGITKWIEAKLVVNEAVAA